jgi:hypothetical protein
MADLGLAAITAQPRTITCAGREVVCCPLTIEDLAAWDTWARKDFLASALAGIDDNPEWKARTEARTAALDEARRISFGSPKAFGSLTSVPGKIQMCWLSMKRNKKDLILDDAWRLIAGDKLSPQSYRNLNTVFAEVMVCSGFMEEADSNLDPSTLASKLIDLMMVR